MPIAPGEIFNPESEIAGILSAKTGDRPARLAEFREKLAYQLDGLAEAEIEIIRMIREDPDISRDELFRAAKAIGSRYGMDKRQKYTMKDALTEYAAKHKAVKKLRVEFPDDKDLFERLFGYRPKGEVGIISDPSTFYIKCHNAEDYASVCRNAGEEENGGEGSLAVSVLAPGAPELGVVAAENMKEVEAKFDEGSAEQKTQKLHMHEEQHVVTEMLEKRSRLPAKKAFEALAVTHQDAPEYERLLDRYLRVAWRTAADTDAKSEILSYFKEGRTIDEIYKELSLGEGGGGIYDMLDLPCGKERVLSELGEREPKEMLERSIERIYGTEYKETFNGAFDALRHFEDAGYPREKTIALLVHEPLPRWGKLADRVLLRHH